MKLSYKTEVYMMDPTKELVIYKSPEGKVIDFTFRDIKTGNSIRLPAGLVVEAIKVIDQ